MALFKASLRYLAPFDRFVILSDLAPETVQDRLATAVERKDYTRTLFTPVRTPFEGWVDEDGFKVNRVTRYNNASHPIARGRLRAAHDGTCIEVSVRQPWTTLVFNALWFVLFAGLLITGVMLMSTRAAAVLIVVPLLTIVLASLLTNGLFWFDNDRTRRKLLEVVDGRLA